jgi:hypothetical protein
MMLWLTSLIGPRIAKYLAVVAAVFGAILALWAKGRSEGSAAARARAAQAEVKAAGERANAEINADREPDPVGRLHKDWPRK